MNWTKWSSIAAIVGSIAIVLTLLSWPLRMREYSFSQFQDGILDEAIWNSYMATIVELLRTPWRAMSQGPLSRLNGCR